jgi:hypothetical protein
MLRNAMHLGAVLVSSLVLTSSGVFAQQVRDHREVPGAAAQWNTGREVGSLEPYAPYNLVRKTHLAVDSSGAPRWENTPPGQGRVMFENCTRPGEVIYSSDRITIRTSDALRYAGHGGKCDFRLIPSGPGFVPAGSGNGAFAIYSIEANRYLVFKPAVTGGSLRWEPTPTGKPPRNVAAAADFVPEELLYSVGRAGDRTFQVVYLTIKNIGNVRSSASQQTMKVKVNGEETEFLIVNPIPPGATLRSIVRLENTISGCTTVELDTNSRLKFQIGEGAFPNPRVFANDVKQLVARRIGTPPPGPEAPLVDNCQTRVVR